MTPPVTDVWLGAKTHDERLAVVKQCTDVAQLEAMMRDPEIAFHTWREVERRRAKVKLARARYQLGYSDAVRKAHFERMALRRQNAEREARNAE